MDDVLHTYLDHIISDSVTLRVFRLRLSEMSSSASQERKEQDNRRAGLFAQRKNDSASSVVGEGISRKTRL
jgi:hypothetical protein